MVRQLLAQGLLAVEGEYGTLVLTEESGPVLARRARGAAAQGPEARPAARPRRASARRSRRRRSPSCPQEAVPLFEALRAWRAAQREGAGRPGLRDLPRRDAARDRDAAAHALAELGTISGVGEKKLAKYGEGVLGVVAERGGAGAEQDEASGAAATAPAPAPAAKPAPAPTSSPIPSPSPSPSPVRRPRRRRTGLGHGGAGLVSAAGEVGSVTRRAAAPSR